MQSTACNQEKYWNVQTVTEVDFKKSCVVETRKLGQGSLHTTD